MLAQSTSTHIELTQRSQAELVLKCFGAEPYQAFCQGEGDEIDLNTTKQELAAEKPRREKEQASLSKTGSNAAGTAPGSQGAIRLESKVQEKMPNHQGRGMCRTQWVLHLGPGSVDTKVDRESVVSLHYPSPFISSL